MTGVLIGAQIAAVIADAAAGQGAVEDEGVDVAAGPVAADEVREAAAAAVDHDTRRNPVSITT